MSCGRMPHIGTSGIGGIGTSGAPPQLPMSGTAPWAGKGGGNMGPAGPSKLPKRLVMPSPSLGGKAKWFNDDIAQGDGVLIPAPQL